MRFTQLHDWLRWLEVQHPRQIDLGLERVAAVAETLALDLPMPVITVAGTNGKGSCVALLNSILRADGYSVGSYTSPHLLRYNERVCIDGEMVDDAALCRAFAEVDRARQGTSLSYFEFGTLAALWLFAEAAPDVLVLEVGLGGRLDAVNIIDADIAIISSVDLDHESWLGNNREDIGREKAGIMRAAKPVVFGDPRPCAAVSQCAIDKLAHLVERGSDFGFEDTAESWLWRGVDRNRQPKVLADLPKPELLLDNAATVIQALQFFPTEISHEAIRAGIEQASVPARGQRLRLRQCDLVLDVAHNAAAVARLADRLGQEAGGRTVAVFALMADKKLESLLGEIKHRIDHWYLPELPGNDRAMAPAALRAGLIAAGIDERRVELIDLHTDLPGVLNAMAGDDTLLAFGSFFTVAAVLEALPASAFAEALH